MRVLPVVLGLCLLGAAVAAWAWLGGEGDLIAPETPPERSVVAADADGGTDLQPMAADLRVDAHEPDASDAAEAADDEVDPAEAERIAATVDPRRSPQVRVVRGDPPVPVADAVVFFVSASDAEAKAATRATPTPSRWECPEAFGQRASTDADGLVRLPRGGVPWLCSAAVGGEFGFLLVPPRDRVHTLVLQTDETLLLQTRGPDGKPTPAVPLAILQQFGDNAAGSIWQQAAERDGRARIRHFQCVRQAAAGQPEPERLTALALVPGAQTTMFRGRPAPTEPVVVAVPPLAGVRASLTDHRGQSLLSRAHVVLAASPGITATDEGLRLPGGLGQQRADKPPGADPVLLPWTQVGVPVQLTARYPNVRRPHSLGPLPAPTEAGQVVEVTFPLGPDHVVIAGQVVTASSDPQQLQPIHDTPITVALWRVDRDLFETTVDPVADGRFDLVLTQRTDAERFVLELRLPLPAAAPGMTAPSCLGARVELPALRGGQRIELGTVQLGELPALVTGLVVDDEANPVANADVQVQWDVSGEGRNERDPWRPLALLRARSGDDGRFRIDGPLPQGKLRVRADTDQHFAASVPLWQQGQDVRITIDRNGVLRGRVLLPDWVADGTLSLQLRPVDETLRQRETRGTDLSRRRGGRFAIEPLRPGRYDALVLLRNVAEPVVVLADVFVRPGETRDNRFGPLDLSAAIHRYRLRAVDQGGQPFPLDGPIVARVQKPDGSFADAGFRWQKGRAELITPSPLADLVFFGRGHRTVRQTLAPGEHDVLLPTVRPAQVELPGLRSLCGPNRKVRISAILQGDTGLPGSLGGTDQRSGERFAFARWDLGRSSGGWLGVTDTVEIPLLQDGKYQIRLRPHATDSERSLQGDLDLGVHELKVDGFDVVRLHLDTAAVLAMLQQLDQNQAQAQSGNRNRMRGTPGPTGR
jgi:hypothetical protein